MTSATIERNAAVQEVKKLRNEMAREDKDRSEVNKTDLILILSPEISYQSFHV